MSLRAVTVYDLNCDAEGCPAQASEDTETLYMLDEMREMARDVGGWAVVNGKDYCANHYCPECETADHKPWVCVDGEDAT